MAASLSGSFTRNSFDQSWDDGMQYTHHRRGDLRPYTFFLLVQLQRRLAVYKSLASPRNHDTELCVLTDRAFAMKWLTPPYSIVCLLLVSCRPYNDDKEVSIKMDQQDNLSNCLAPRWRMCENYLRKSLRKKCKTRLRIDQHRSWHCNCLPWHFIQSVSDHPPTKH
jgi:hypothetical protein